jgi:multisubunit Na+/H+ antiporter MnhE subunit
MSFWVIIDDSLGLSELLAGAGFAALGAFAAEIAGHQAATRFRMRIEWLVPALRLPGQLAADTYLVFAALWRLLAHGEEPRSGFRQQHVRFGTNTAEGKTRRALLVAGRSFTPNGFVLGLDADREVMIFHQLVITEGESAE